MTDSEGMAEDATVAPALAAPQTPTQDLANAHDPAVDPAPVTVAPVTAAPAADQAPVTLAPRRRRRWPAFVLAAVVILGLAAGLVVWAPWVVPPVLRPTGLAAGPSTDNSIAFHWSRPATGPLPDKYLILGQGMKAATVAGTVTAYRQAGLTPASNYQYHVVAVRGGKRSPQSAVLILSTLTPPVSAARLQGSWQVYVKNFVGPRASGYITWQVTPACAVGPCDVMVHASSSSHFDFTMKLTRAGAAYSGHTVTSLGPCGSGANAIPDPVTLKVQIRVNAAIGQNLVWAASSFAGTIVGTTQYVSNSAGGYCNAGTVKASLNGSPG